MYWRKNVRIASCYAATNDKPYLYRIPVSVWGVGVIIMSYHILSYHIATVYIYVHNVIVMTSSSYHAHHVIRIMRVMAIASPVVCHAVIKLPYKPHPKSCDETSSLCICLKRQIINVLIACYNVILCWEGGTEGL
jgi:hypothetical protein